jgi:hypothetical protein
MLLPAQVTPFLQHQDRHLRRLAVAYLTQAHDPSPATAQDLWRMLDQFGSVDPEGSGYEYLPELPQNEASLTRTLKQLETEKHLDRRDQLEDVIRRMQFGLLTRFRDIVEGSKALSEGLRRELAARFEFGTLPPRELWDRLDALSQLTHSPEQLRDLPYLIEALSRHPEAAQWAIALLSDPAIRDLRQVFALELLGRMRHRPAVEIVADKLIQDDNADPLTESAADALIRIGGEQVVSAMRDRLGRMSPATKLYAADALSGTKLPAAEAVLIGILERESNETVRAKIATALCQIGTAEPRALGLLRDFVNSGKWNIAISEVDADVYALFTMIGHDVPEMAAWRERLDDTKARAKAIRAANKKLDKLISSSSDQPDSSEAGWLADDDLSQGRVKPIRRETEKVGRNDPCPCGSGKKYKKCCGK